MPLFDFECEHGHRSEELMLDAPDEITCGRCLHPARRIYSRAAALTHAEPDTRGMYRRFTEASAEMNHRGVDGSGLWKQAKQTAGAMIRAGENPHQRTD